MHTTSLRQETVSIQNYNAIDLVKFVCALLVCAIHIPLSDYESVGFLKALDFAMRNWIGRLAVPFFFTAAGFFLFRNLQACDTQRIKNYCFKLLRLNGVWFVLLIIGDKMTHLWYLGSTITAVLLIAMLIRKSVGLKRMLIIAGGLYAIGLLGDTYCALLDPLMEFGLFRWIDGLYGFFFGSTRNGFFMGFIFVLIGAMLAKHPIKIKLSVAYAALIASLAILLAEAYFVKRTWNVEHPNMYIFLPVTAFFLFYTVCNTKLKDRPIYRKLRAASVLIYFMHVPAVKLVFALFMDLNRLRIVIPVFPTLYFGSVCLCIVLAFGIEWISRKEKFRWLRYLYS